MEENLKEKPTPSTGRLISELILLCHSKHLLSFITQSSGFPALICGPPWLQEAIVGMIIRRGLSPLFL
jgi:hypothetical protein